MATEEDASERLFELANAVHVNFSVPNGPVICVRQDPANTTTGGCVWETSYLMALYALRELEPRLRARSRGGTPVRCLEVGAGYGFGVRVCSLHVLGEGNQVRRAVHFCPLQAHAGRRKGHTQSN